MILQNSHLSPPFADAFTTLTKSGQRKPITGRLSEFRPRISQYSNHSEDSIAIQSRKDPNYKKVIKKPRNMNRLHCLVAGNMQQASQAINTGLNCSDIFYDSSDPNDTRNSINSSPQIKALETPAVDSLKEMFKLKKRGASRGSKDLLYLLNNQIQNETFIPSTRVRKNRDSFLYKNLNQLMGGRSNPESAVVKADSVKFHSNDTQASLVDDEYDRFDDLQQTEDLGSFGDNMLNNNFIHSSINTVREKIAKQLMIQSAGINKNKKIWNVERELQLLKYFEIYGQDWEAIAMAINIPEITPSAVEERYKAKFLSNTSKARFTPQEDKQIAFYYTKFGPNWKKMQEFFPERTEAMIRNRFNSKIKKKNVKEFLKTNFIAESLKNGESEEPYSRESSSGSPFNSLDGKATAKNSEPEIETGTLEAVDLDGYCFTPKKLKTDSQTQFITTKIAETNLPGNSYAPKINNIDKEGRKNQNAVREAPGNAPNALNYNSNSFGLYQGEVEDFQAQFENLENFEMGLQLPEENVQEYRQILSPRNDFGVNPYNNNFKQRKDFDYWDFRLIEDQIKSPNDFIDFERGSDRRQEQEPHFNSINNENCYLNYLNFQEDEPGNFREQPLMSICGSPRKTTPYSMQEPVSYNQHDFQEPPRVENEHPQFNGAPGYKLNQLETLLSQIKSIEAMFDRTKQQISQLKNRYATN